MTLALWTIYDHPKDVPDAFVARRFALDAGSARAELLSIVASDLAEIRAWFAAAGLTCLARAHDDDPVIVECWL